MFLPLFLRSRNLRLLSVQLLRQQSHLCLRLLLRSLCFGQLVLLLRLRPIFLSPKQFQIATKGLRVLFLHPLQISL